MVGFLIRRFVKNADDTADPRVRSAYGTVCGIFGIFLNIILFAIKLFAGLVSGSLAITADAFNNLSDAGSSVITLAGFRLASKKPDPDHPFGHGRLEYISGSVVAVFIILMGFELAKSSFGKLLAPTKPEFNIIIAVILIISILGKLYMSLYNKKYGNVISSSAMLATASDSLSDTLSTAVVLVSGVVCHFTGFVYLDSICGLAVSVFIMIAGIRAIKDTVSPLLGQAPSEEFVNKIAELATSDKRVLGIHDMVVHDYGPGRVMVSLHAEVSGDENVYELHEMIDALEMLISEKLGCETVIHLDPTDLSDERLSNVRKIISRAVQKLDERASFHDVRIVPGENRSNVIFDLVLPNDCRLSEKDARVLIGQFVASCEPTYRCVIKIDRDYVNHTTK